MSNEPLSESSKLNTIIIPAWREAKGLPVVLSKIFQVINDSYEVIVVDDGSDDKTSEVASEFPVRLIRHEVNKGKGEALKTGIRQAGGENIIWIDADDTYPVEFIPKVAQGLNMYDVVVCSRRFGSNNIPMFNRFGNFIFRNMIKAIYGFKPYDPCSGLYGAKRRYLEMMNLFSQRFTIEPEISIKAARMRLKMLDIPIEYGIRVGDTKLSRIKVGVEDLTTILKLVFWQRGKGDGK